MVPIEIFFIMKFKNWSQKYLSLTYFIITQKIVGPIWKWARGNMLEQSILSKEIYLISTHLCTQVSPLLWDPHCYSVTLS